MAAKKETAAAPAASSDKKKAIETAMQQIEKMYGKGSIMRYGDGNVANVEAIPTGSLALDLALGIGGLPRGRIVEIYGPESSGKTTLAARLQKDLDCRVFHMDDFFLRPQQRTAERFAQPGENVDHERFLEEVLLPLRSGQPLTYRPFSCAQQQLGAPVTAAPCRLAIVEGAYACHPDLWAYYDLRVFLTVDPETQMQRIEARSGAAKAAQFRDRWIPFEETYFSALDVQARCDMCISG